jgi:ribosome-associated protein
MNLKDRYFDREFEFFVSRSGGPGGQHVNTSDSKVELRFNVDKSELLSEEEKELVKQKLINKINKDGILQIVSQKERSQFRNKQNCIERFYILIESALHKQKKRKKTKPSFKSVLKRLERKKQHSEKKDRRKKDWQ